MHAITQIPKVLERLQQIHAQKPIEQLFKEYKKNVKIFVENVKQEISQLIDNYEAVIYELKAQNKKLKESGPSKEFVRTNPSGFSPSKQFPTAYSSKMQNARGLLDTIQTAKSNVFFPQGSKRLSPVLKHDQNSCFSNQMNPQGQSFDKQASRFQAKSQRKKHRQQQIRHFLESGNKSMNFTTKRFMQAIGKGQKDKRYFIEEEDEQVEAKLNKEQTQSKTDSGLNKSLGAICESLDTSFISKRARSQRDKRLNKMDEDLQKKRKQQEFVQEMVKQKGLKSLLKRLRDNVQSSPKQLISPIKASKIISSQKEQMTQSKMSNKNSKVMINPVPIDIQKKSKATRKQNSISPTSPSKKPHSILKNSTILSRSIQGISAIDFAQ